MSGPSPLRGVVFDLDGTLYDKQPLEWFMVRSMPLSLLRLLRYTRVRTGLAGVDLGSGPAIARETLQRLSPDPGKQQQWVRWIAEHYEPAVIRGLREASALQPGVQALLDRLRAAGVRLGLVSDYRGVPDRLAALGLAPTSFDLVLVTEELGAMKPAPRMAELTLERMGLPGSAMVMVGDRAFADQRFAEAAGMRFLGVRAKGKPGDTWMPWTAARDRLLRWAGAAGHVPSDMP
jgi:putative hydrolase of the HAD superfamily